MIGGVVVIDHYKVMGVLQRKFLVRNVGGYIANIIFVADMPILWVSNC